MVGRVLAAMALPALDGLSERFERGDTPRCRGRGGGVGVRLLHGGSGRRVVGLDPLPRAIDLAAKNVDDHGLTDRIEIRLQGVEHLDEHERYDLAFVALPFIPADVATEGLNRVSNALKPGGWLVLPGSVDAPGPLARSPGGRPTSPAAPC